MNLEQAIKTALEYENNVCGIYKQAQAQAKDPLGKRIFGVLAKEERGHIDYLEHRLEEWKRTGKLTVETLKTVVPSADKIAAGLEAMQRKVEGKRALASVEIEQLQKAVEAEQTTSSFYKRMVQELDADGQCLFARFVEIEEGHLAIVMAELDSVQGLGYWFDMPEWQFQDG